MKKTIVYYKVRFDGSNDLGHYMKERCFNDLDTAIEYAEGCWQKYKPLFLKPKERNLIYEYASKTRLLDGYIHQIITTWNDGYAQVTSFRVDKHRLSLLDNIEE